MGTPAYMPPEQARGEAALVDARADVFALGAILCEVLTNQPPYAGNSDEVCRKAAAGDLAEAQARLDACGADEALRELARRCLAAEPSARPPDAGVVARDLTAYLASAQERLRQAQLQSAAAEARAQEAGAKAKAERRARRLTLALAVVALLLFLGAAAAPTVAYVLLRAEQQQTEAPRQAAVAAREDEARQRRQARQALDLLSKPVLENWLSKQPMLGPDEKHFLEQALVVYAELAAEMSTDEASQAAVARAYGEVGHIQFLLRRLPEAEAAYDRGAAVYARLLARTPGQLTFRKELARLLNNRYNVLNGTGRHEQADASLRDLVKLERQLVAEANDRDSLYYLAHSLTHLSSRCRVQGKLQEAEALVRESLALSQKLAADPSSTFAIRHGLASARYTLGCVLAATGRPAEAVENCRGAQKEQEELTARYPHVCHARRDLGNTYTMLAGLLWQTRRRQEAEATYQKALKVRRELVADFPGQPALYEDLAATHSRLGNVLTVLGRHRDALAVYESAIALYEKLPAKLAKQLNHRRSLARAWFNLAPTLGMLKRPKEAEAAGREAQRLYRALADENPTEPEFQDSLASSLDNLAGWAHQRGEWEEARCLANEALAHHRAAVQARPASKEYLYRLCINRRNLALILVTARQHAEAAEAAGQLAEAAVAEFPSEIMKAAAFLARCAPLAEQDARLSDARRAELAQSYAERSMKTLRLAVKHGYRDAARLETMPSFAPVRSRLDFQELLAELKKLPKMP
jgi:tetratricopeptide (TPR) repeat protein